MSRSRTAPAGIDSSQARAATVSGVSVRFEHRPTEGTQKVSQLPLAWSLGRGLVVARWYELRRDSATPQRRRRRQDAFSCRSGCQFPLFGQALQAGCIDCAELVAAFAQPALFGIIWRVRTNVRLHQVVTRSLPVHWPLVAKERSQVAFGGATPTYPARYEREPTGMLAIELPQRVE